MKKLVIEVSIRETQKGVEAINDYGWLRNQLNATSSNTWESEKEFDEWNEDDRVELEQLQQTIGEQMEMFGIEEFEIMVIDTKEDW